MGVIGHSFAIACFYSETLSYIAVFGLFSSVLWYGASFYMDTFAKQYEQRLAALESMTDAVSPIKKSNKGDTKDKTKSIKA